MFRFAAGNFAPFARDFHVVTEADHSRIRLKQRDPDGDLIIESRWAEVAAVGFNNREKHAVERFHIFIHKSDGPAIIDARHLHPD